MTPALLANPWQPPALDVPAPATIPVVTFRPDEPPVVAIELPVPEEAPIVSIASATNPLYHALRAASICWMRSPPADLASSRTRR